MSVNTTTTIQKIIDAVDNHAAIINKLAERMNTIIVLVFGLYIILGVFLLIKIIKYVKRNIKIVRVKKVG